MKQIDQDNPFTARKNELVENGDQLGIKRVQDIPQSHIDRLKREFDDSKTTKAGEMHRVASIPVAVIESWMAQGYNISEMTAAEILKKLREDHLDVFITSKKIG